MSICGLVLVIAFRCLPGFERLDDTRHNETDASGEADERGRVHAQSKEHHGADERRSGNQREYDGGEFVDPVLRFPVIGIDFDYTFLTVDFGMQGILGHTKNPVRRAGKSLFVFGEFLAGRQGAGRHLHMSQRLSAIHRLPDRIAGQIPSLGLQFERRHDFRSLRFSRPARQSRCHLRFESANHRLLR